MEAQHALCSQDEQFLWKIPLLEREKGDFRGKNMQYYRNSRIKPLSCYKR